MNTSSAEYQEYTAYLDELRERLTVAEGELQSAQNTSAEKKVDFDNKAARYDTLKANWETIDAVNESAKKTIQEIQNGHQAVMQAAGNALLTRRALAVLSIESEKTGDEAVALKGLVEELVGALGEATPPPDPNSDIMKAIQGVESAAADFLSSSLASIPDILEAFQSSALLKNYLGDQNNSLGLTRSLHTLLSFIHYGTPPNEPYMFPREDCPRDYFEETEEAYETAKTERDEAEQAWEDAEAKKEQAEAKKNAIQQSLAAAESASTC